MEERERVRGRRKGEGGWGREERGTGRRVRGREGTKLAVDVMY